LADSEFVKKLKAHKVDRVILSFDGFNPHTYAKMRGWKHELLFKMLALKNLTREGILTFLSTTIAMGINDNEIDKLLRFVMRCVKRKKSIRGIFFYAATRFGRYLIDEDMKVSELLRRLEGTNFGIRIEYFIEMKRFLLNLSHVLSKFGFLIPVGSTGLVAIYRVGSLKEWIPLTELIEINKLFEENKVKALLKTIRKIKFLNPIKNFYHILLNSNLMVIGVGGLHTPDNFLPYLSDTIGIERNKSGGIPFVNSYDITVNELGA
jgi:MoaA/NifB/PqqE/SkfB family radical SAM enzyme